jgi:hypothetical protein
MRIDVHAHYWTKDYLDLLTGLGKADAGAARRLRCRQVSPDGRAAPTACTRQAWESALVTLPARRARRVQR